ncbi:MAG TPA: hypothetical protein VMU95_39850 [Trebonia sp.]|nr:hypothetical protein [Trebonia sp.]
MSPDPVWYAFRAWSDEEHDPDEGGGPPHDQDDMEKAFTAGWNAALAYPR